MRKYTKEQTAIYCENAKAKVANERKRCELNGLLYINECPITGLPLHENSISSPGTCGKFAQLRKSGRKSFSTLVAIVFFSTISVCQSSAGIGVIGFSPRNNGAFVQTVFAQVDLLQPQETILHFGAGFQLTAEYTQALHAVPYAYAAVELRDIYLGIRAGASYTRHIDDRLKQNVGKSKWFSYTALHIDWINDRKVGAFMTINYSPKNNYDVVMGIRYLL